MERRPYFAVVFRAIFYVFRCFRAYVYQSIHAQTIITSMFESIRLPEHPCPNHNNIHVQEHTFTRASMPTMITCMFESIRLPEHPCTSHSNIHVREHTSGKESLHVNPKKCIEPNICLHVLSSCFRNPSNTQVKFSFRCKKTPRQNLAVHRVVSPIALTQS